MDDEHELPDQIDPEVWFACHRDPAARDYLVSEPWQTFPGRMQAWCGAQRVWFRASKSELPDDLPAATRYWVAGFLTGNVPRQPDTDTDGPAVAAWRRLADEFLATGAWEGDQLSDQTSRWFTDASVLSDIGRAVAETPMPDVEVRLPRDLADRALAARRREEPEVPDYESTTVREARRAASDLALIGLALENAHRVDGERVVVSIPVDLVTAAIRASEDETTARHCGADWWITPSAAPSPGSRGSRRRP